MGFVEALAHRSQQVRRLLDLGSSWSNSSTDNVLRTTVPYRTAKQLSPDEVDELVRAWEAGQGVQKLAVQFGVHRQTVGKHLQARGIDTLEKLTPEQLSEAVDLYQAGWSLARLAGRYNISDKTIGSRLVEAGVAMRKRRGGRQKATVPLLPQP